MFALWTMVTFFRPWLEGVLEGVADDPLAAGAGDDRHRLGHGARVVADLHEVLDPDVEPLEVLAHQHDVHVLEPAAGHDRPRRAHVGEQLELLAEPDVHRAEPGADRRGERALEREGVLPDALDRGVGQRRAGGVDRGHARPAPRPS